MPTVKRSKVSKAKKPVRKTNVPKRNGASAKKSKSVSTKAGNKTPKKKSVKQIYASGGFKAVKEHLAKETKAAGPKLKREYKKMAESLSEKLDELARAKKQRIDGEKA